MIDRYHVNEYYSGAQVRVYFGHLLIDEIASIEWAGTSTKRPVYGYASTTFDAVAQGQYLCQGAFLMPFKEVGFLYAVQQSLANRGAASLRIVNAIKQQSKQAGTVTATPEGSGSSPRVRVTTRQGTALEGASQVEDVVTSLTPEDLLDQSAGQGGQPFHDLVEALQNTIWDNSEGDREPIVRPDEFDLDRTMGFVQQGFNILVTFGDVNNPKQSSTAKSLIDVHLTGDQRVIGTEGAPIFERYTFFCRATDETLGQYRIIPSRPAAATADPSAPPSETPALRTIPADPIQTPGTEGTVPPVTPAQRTAKQLVQPIPTPRPPPSRSSQTRSNVASSGVRIGGPFAVGGGVIVTVAQFHILPRPIVGHIDAGSAVEALQLLVDTHGRRWYYVRRISTGEYTWTGIAPN